MHKVNKKYSCKTTENPKQEQKQKLPRPMAKETNNNGIRNKSTPHNNQ